VALDPSLECPFEVEIDAAVAVIRRQDFSDIRVDGALRLSTGFAAGAASTRGRSHRRLS
jgi:hypothetical protein